MKRPYVLKAVGSEDGRIFAKKEINKNDLKAYLSDTEITLISAKGYDVKFFPSVFETIARVAAKLGVRAIPHSTEAVCVSKQFRSFISEVEKLQDEEKKLTKSYVIVTTVNGANSEYEECPQLLRMIKEEQMRFRENTGIMP